MSRASCFICFHPDNYIYSIFVGPHSMKTSTQEALHSNHCIAARSSAICVLAYILIAPLPLGAQEVTRVYPRYVISGQETHFTIVGKQLPLEASTATGMKFSFSKLAECRDAKRDKPPTPTRHYFACQFKSDSDKSRFSVLYQQKPKSKRKTKTKPSVTLWDEPLQVLRAPPHIDSVTLAGELGSGLSIINCNPVTTCTTIIGDLRTGKPVLIDISGSNLPYTLQLSFAGCKSSFTASELKNTTTRSFTCNTPTEGDHSLRVVSAPKVEGGVELLSSRVAVQQGPALGTP